MIGTRRKVGQLFDFTSLQHSSVFPPSSALVNDNAIYQLHLLLGNASPDKPCNLFSIGTLNNVSKFSPFDCLNCKLAKQPVLSFTTSTSLCHTLFGLVHYDIWGSTPSTIVNGCKYFVLFIDGYSRFTWIYFLK